MINLQWEKNTQGTKTSLTHSNNEKTEVVLIHVYGKIWYDICETPGLTDVGILPTWKRMQNLVLQTVFRDKHLAYRWANDLDAQSIDSTTVYDTEMW